MVDIGSVVGNVAAVKQCLEGTDCCVPAKIHLCGRCEIANLEFFVIYFLNESGFGIAKFRCSLYHHFVRRKIRAIRQNYNSCGVSAENGVRKCVYNIKFHFLPPLAAAAAMGFFHMGKPRVTY